VQGVRNPTPLDEMQLSIKTGILQKN